MIRDEEAQAERDRTQEYMERAVSAATALGHQIGGFYDSVDSGGKVQFREAKCVRSGCDKRIAYHLEDGKPFGDAYEGVCCNPNPRYRGNNPQPSSPLPVKTAAVRVLGRKR
jgi:hypothetical protein